MTFFASERRVKEEVMTRQDEERKSSGSFL